MRDLFEELEDLIIKRKDALLTCKVYEDLKAQQTKNAAYYELKLKEADKQALEIRTQIKSLCHQIK